MKNFDVIAIGHEDFKVYKTDSYLIAMSIIFIIHKGANRVWNVGVRAEQDFSRLQDLKARNL